MAPDARFPASLGGFDSRRTPILRTDVLVIGGGIAGAAAALAAAEDGASVLVLSKTALEESNTAYAQGGLAAVLASNDSVDLHLADTLRVGAGLADPAVARRILGEGPRVVEWLSALGTRFDRGPASRFLLSREGGHSVDRVVHADGDATGAELQRALKSALAAHPQITLREGSYVRDLLVHERRCVGAVAWIATSAGVSELAIEAGAVVLATGGAGQVFRETTNPIGASGDGMALAFRAGAELADMEFVQFHPTTLYIAGAARFLISEVVRGAGAVLRDRKGVRFMEGKHPLADLAPRDVVSRAILERMVASGDTHVFLDLRGVRGNPHALFPSISKICASFDIDIARDPIPVRPGAHYAIGGVRADHEGHASLHGLFAVGECAATGLHGANRLASNSLLEGAVTGRSAGAIAARDARAKHPGLPRAVPPPALPENRPKLHLDDVLYSLKSLMWLKVGLTRDGAGLRDAIERVGVWHHYLMRAGTPDVESCELANMLTVSALIATAALWREESRGTHWRSDHGERDDAHFCRHLRLARGESGEFVSVAGAVTAPSDPS